MEQSMESTNPEPVETGSTIQESLEKIVRARETEWNSTIDRLEHNSSHVLDRVKNLYDTSIVQAMQDVTVESDRLITKLKEEAEELLIESREKASTEARQESARIIGETKEKTAQIIREVIERDITQTKNELARATSEARSRLETEKSTLLGVTRRIEQIIDETETHIRAGIEHLAYLTSEIETKLQAIIEIPDRGAVAESQQAAQRDTGKSQYIEPPENQGQKVSGEETGLKPEESPKAEYFENDKSDVRTRTLEGAALPGPQTQEEIRVSREAEKRVRKEAQDVKLDAKILMRQGEVLLESGKNEEALDAFTKVVDLEPRNAIAWRKRGTTLSALGRNEEALEAFTKVIELDPNDFIALHNKTVLTNLRKKKEVEEAEEAESRARKEVENSKLDVNMLMHNGERLLESGKNEEAVEVFLKVIEHDPKNGIAWRNKSTALGLLGRHEEAFEAAVKAIDLNSNDVIAWHNKVAALTNLRKIEEAKIAQEAEKQVIKDTKRD